MKLLPRQINSSIARQRVQHLRLDGVNYFLRRSRGRPEIKPAPGRETRIIESKNVFSDGIAATKAIKEPSIHAFFAKSGLDRIDQLPVHDSIILFLLRPRE